jgi:tRNA pseudouridine55 synthase
MTKGRRQAGKHGYVVIDKPARWTSHDVVARVRRILGERRVGHAGTLDPAAVGVLPIAVGLATRTVEYLANATKSYRADITFGVQTDSCDSDGIVTRIVDASHVTGPGVAEVLKTFLGPQLQKPPMHSAVKVGGERLYRLARKGQDIDVPLREIRIHALETVDWQSPTLTVDITCSKGTYIRALARDLGEKVGTGAYLSHLVRTRTGPFTLDDAVSLGDLGALSETLGWGGLAFHPDWVLQDLMAVVIDEETARSWRKGQTVECDSIVCGTVRVYDADGTWLGIGEAASGSIRSTKVIPPA